MRLVRNMLVTVSLLLPCDAYAQEKPILDQVRDIVTSSEGTVRKWIYAPKLVVVYDRASYEDEITALVDELNTKVTGFPGIREVEYYDVNGFNNNYYGRTFFRTFVEDHDGIERTVGRLVFHSNTHTVVREADIFLFLTDLKTGILFSEVVGTDDAAFQRLGFAESISKTTCYMNMMSLYNELQIAWIFINRDDEVELLKHCIYEELTQTLGLLRDTEWSSVFTYNDRSGPIVDTSADFHLLNALYGENVSPGDSPERVVEEFARITGEGR